MPLTMGYSPAQRAQADACVARRRVPRQRGQTKGGGDALIASGRAGCRRAATYTTRTTETGSDQVGPGRAGSTRRGAAVDTGPRVPSQVRGAWYTPTHTL